MPHGDRTTIVLRPTHVLDLRLIFEVFKLRIGLVIGLTAIAGLAVAPGRSLPAWKVGALALAVTLASAAAGAFNQYAERDLDARMGRTRNRAFVTGRLAAGPAWLVAIVAAGALDHRDHHLKPRRPRACPRGPHPYRQAFSRNCERLQSS